MPDATDTPRRDLAATAAAATLLAVMAIGAWQAVGALRHPALVEVPHGWAAIWSGEASAAFGKHLDQHLPWRDGLIAGANAARYRLLRGGGEQVRVGRDGWLFSTEESRIDPQARRHAADRLATVQQAAAALRDRGIVLVVALVPDKWRVHASEAPGGTYPAWHRDRYRDALASLRAAGVPTVDLLAPLASAARVRPVYFRTDTHWNPDGADVAAAAIADAVRAAVPDLATGAFETSVGADTVRPGDLIGMMGLGPAPDAVRPRPDREQARSTRAVDAGAAGAVDLFGNRAVDVTLVGTSYSRRANFHGALQQRLGAEVLEAARDGGGFLQALDGYLRDGAFTESPPRVIVWEIPERVLTGPAPERLDPALLSTPR